MKLQIGRHARSQFQHFPIQEGHAHLEVGGHRSFIRSHEIQAGQKSFQIDIEQLIERRRILHSREIMAVRTVRVHTTSRCAQVVGVKPRFRIIREIGFISQVAILEIECGAARKLLRVSERRR